MANLETTRRGFLKLFGLGGAAAAAIGGGLDLFSANPMLVGQADHYVFDHYVFEAGNGPTPTLGT